MNKNVLILLSVLILAIMSFGVTATDSTNPADYLFYDDMESGSISTKYDVTFNFDYSNAVAYAGSRSILVAEDNVGNWEYTNIRNNYYNTTSATNATCMDFRYYVSTVATYNSECQGIGYRNETGTLNEVYGMVNCYLSAKGGEGYHTVGKYDGSWTERQTSVPTGVWRYNKFCLSDGYASSGTTTITGSNETDTIFSLTFSRNSAGRIGFASLGSVSNPRFYIDNLRVWDVGVWGTSPPRDLIAPNVGTPAIYSGTVYSTYYKGTIAIRSTVTDNLAINESSCEYSINGGSNWYAASYSGGYCYKESLTPNADINIQFRVKDNDGNTGTSSAVAYTYDGTAPTVATPALYTGTYSTTYVKNAAIGVRSSVSDGGSGLNTGTCYYRVNSGAWTAASYSGGYCQVASYTPSGNVAFEFNISDNLATSGGSSALSLTYDVTAPTTTAVGKSANTTAYTFGNIAFRYVNVTFTNTDAGSGYNRTAYCLDTTNTCTPTTTWNNANITISTSGTSYIRYLADDKLGNTNSIQTSQININVLNFTISSITNHAWYNISDLALNYTITNNSAIDKCVYSLDMAANVTINNCLNITLEDLVDGNHNITLYVNNTYQTYSQYLNFSIDTVYPIITYSITNNKQYYINNITGSFQFNDSNMERYNLTLDSTQVTTGTANVTYSYNYNTSLTRLGKHILYMNVSDKAGNKVNYTYSFYNLKPNLTYDSIMFGSLNHTYQLNLNYNQSDISYGNINSVFYFNASSRLTTKTSTPLDFIFNSESYIPILATETNITSYWNVSYADNTNDIIYFNQTARNFRIAPCLLQPTWVNILNLTFYDEETLVRSGNVSANMDITIIYNNLSSIKFGLELRNNNTYEICLDPNYINITVNSKIEYYNSTYSNRKYYIFNYFLDNTTDVLNLYTIDNDVASDVVLNVYDKGTGKPISDAIVKILRYYPQSNQSSDYKTVEVELTDVSGQTGAKLVLADVWYKFIVEKPAGNVLLNSDIEKILSTDKLIGISQNENALLTYNEVLGINKDVSCDKTTQICRFTWSNPSNLPVRGELRILSDNGFRKTLVYNASETSAAATIAYQVTGNITTTKYIAEGWVYTS